MMLFMTFFTMLRKTKAADQGFILPRPNQDMTTKQFQNLTAVVVGGRFQRYRRHG